MLSEDSGKWKLNRFKYIRDCWKHETMQFPGTQILTFRWKLPNVSFTYFFHFSPLFFNVESFMLAVIYVYSCN